MMRNVEESKNVLLEAIRESDSFQRFNESKKKIEGREDLKRQIDDYRRRCYLLQSGSSSEELDTEIQKVRTDREILKTDPIIQEYLDSELDLCRMLQRISIEIMNVTDLQIEPFEECIITDEGVS